MVPGTLVDGRFELLALAGAGGMGVVYRARDGATGATVALKILHEREPLVVDRFAREARVLAELKHPGIVRHVAHGRDAAGLPYLAMEWLEGEDLGARLAGGPLSIDESITVAVRAADALGAAHAIGIVHRDVKPTNLFLRGGRLEEVTLLDFGVARRGALPAVTRTGAIVGTPGYMAPEQARGSGEIDARVDVFALGCVLFQCLTGQAPFAAEDLLALFAKIVLDTPPALTDLVPDAPNDLARLVERMLSKESAARPADGAAVAAALAAIPPSPIRSRPPRPAPPALGASERRLLCVVLGRGAPPPEAADAARRRMTLLAVAVEYGGEVELLADGSVVAAFRGTGTARDLALRAVRCAIALDGRGEPGPFAVVTGHALIERRHPIGETIDRANRLLAQGEPGRITLCEVTTALLGTQADVEPGGRLRTLHTDHAAGEPPALLLGRATPCVGRDRELLTLAALVRECEEDSVARAVLVTAPPGMGKSRLASELLRSIAGERRELWLGRGDAIGAGSPFATIASALRRAAGILAGDAISVQRHQLTAWIARAAAGAESLRIAAFLGETIGTPFPDETTPLLAAARGDPAAMAQGMRSAWLDLLVAVTRDRPLLLVMEDLHWGDRPSVQLVDAALRALADRPFLVLALARPEVHDLFPRLWSERRLQEIHLTPLTARAAARLVKAVLGEDVPDDLLGRILAHAEGNAFHLEELVRSVAAGVTETLPTTLVAMMHARLDALGPSERRVLRAASVFGERFWGGGLAALLGGAPSPDDLRALVEREIVVRSPAARFAGEEELAFRHALLREAAYQLLTDEDRKLGHRLAGQWLEQKGESDAVALAAHFERGALPAAAAKAYRRAAEQALEGQDFAEVIVRVERGVACLAEAGDDGGGAEAFAALRHLEGSARAYRGEHVEGVRAEEEAVAMSRPGTEAHRQAWRMLLAIRGYLGRMEEIRAMAEALLSEDGPADRDGDLVTMAMVMLARNGDYALAERLWAVLRERLGDGPYAPVAEAQLHYALLFLAERDGDAQGVLTHSLAAAEGFRRIGQTVLHCQHLGNAAAACNRLGAYARAREHVEEALAHGRRLELGGVEAFLRYCLGQALAAEGELAEACRLLRESAEAFERMGNRLNGSDARSALSGALLARGDLSGAETEADRAIETAPNPAKRALAQMRLAAVLVRTGRAADAVPLAADAVATLDAASEREGRTEAGLVHAEALDGAGRTEEARRALAATREVLVSLAARIEDRGLRASYLSRAEHLRTVELAVTWGI